MDDDGGCRYYAEDAPGLLVMRYTPPGDEGQLCGYGAQDAPADQQETRKYWVVTDASGNRQAELRYKAYGETRYTQGDTPTAFRFTGQREDGTIGLYFYNARFYDPVLGRFIQADTIVPNPADPQDFNRYSYVQNNPLRYTDPSGHCRQPGGCVILGGGDRNPAWEFFIQGKWYEGWSFDEFGPAYQAGLEAAAGERGRSATAAFAKGLTDRLTGERGEWAGVYLVAYSQADLKSWTAEWASASNLYTGLAIGAMGSYYAPTMMPERLGPGGTYSGETYKFNLESRGIGGGDAGLRQQVGDVLNNIDQGGPFPYKRDGIVFQNREGLLPEQPVGYYREYTVTTPGAPNRGTQRLVVGQGGEVYYTPDHYQTFVQIRE